jgi:hypothetical protein
VVINLTWEIVALSVINQLISIVVKLNAIAKICKYRGLHEGHHFILITMEVDSALRCDMDCFIRECAHLFMINN